LNNKQQTKQRASKEKAKTSTIIAKTQPQATTSAAATTLKTSFQTVTVKGCPIFQRITFVVFVKNSHLMLCIYHTLLNL